MNISIRHIEHFVAVAQQLHFRRAAQLVNVAQPALSRSVQTLETELGVQLLDRNNRNVRLTAAGKEFLAGCTDIIDTMETTINRSVRASQSEFGGLNIGYTYIAMSGTLPTLLAEFESKNPNIAIEPMEISSTDQLERLHQNELDICFLTGPTNTNELGTAAFQSNSFIAIVNDNHRFANKTSISIEELSREKIMLRTDSKASAFNQHVFDFFSEAGQEPNIEFVDQNHIGLQGKVALDHGVCIATQGYNCIFAKKIKPLTITGITSTLPTIMAWRKNTDSASIATFRQFILDSVTLANHKPTLQPEPSTLVQHESRKTEEVP